MKCAIDSASDVMSLLMPQMEEEKTTRAAELLVQEVFPDMLSEPDKG